MMRATALKSSLSGKRREQCVAIQGDVLPQSMSGLSILKEHAADAIPLAPFQFLSGSWETFICAFFVLLHD